MAIASVSDDEFIELFKTIGAAKAAKAIGVDVSNIHQRRRRIEKRLGVQLLNPVSPFYRKPEQTRHPARIELSVSNGVVLVGSDLHIWPGPPSVTQRFMLKLAKDVRPQAIVLNGDVLDCSTISRWPDIGWETKPKLHEELEAAKDRLHEFEKATPRGCKLIWTLGNHDMRFEMRMAAAVPQFEKIDGVHLKDHFPQWTPGWSAWINNEVVIKHRFKGGIHAVHNNTLWGGKSMVTGHLHCARVVPFSDYNGTRYGVDGGCMCDPNGPQFINYTEDNPKNHRQAFVVLTFKDGQLLMPELVLAMDEERVQFRGEVIRV